MVSLEARKINISELARKKELAPAKGVLADFLRDSFFPGAVEANFLSPEDIQAMPRLINDIVASLFPADNQERLFSDLVVISSVAKEITWKHLTGDIPHDFWADYKHMHDVMQHLKKSASQSVRDYAWSFDETRVDMDVKLLDAQDTPMKVLAMKVARHFHVGNIYRAPVGNTRQEEFKFDHEGYRIRVLYGPSPTNETIELMKVSILNPHNDQELFHVDISKAGRLEDKRSGTTTLKQDACVATLFLRNGIVGYRAETDALDVMRRQDSFDSTSENPTQLLELFLRGLRQNLLHIPRENIEGQKTEYIHLVDGSVMSLPQLDMFFPLFTSASLDSDSLFFLRRTIRSAMVNGIHMLPEENPQYIRMLQKELHVCLQRDPYMTIQALRDTGIALAIPGLRSLSDADWNKVLTSEEFVMDLAKRTTFSRRRSFDFMSHQRAIYLGNDVFGIRHFDGLERFMRALNSNNKDHEWDAYLALWNVSNREVMIQPTTFDFSSDTTVAGLLIEHGGHKLRVMKDDGSRIQPRDVIALFDAMRKGGTENDPPMGNWESHIDAALTQIDHKSHLSWVREAVDRRGMEVVNHANEKELAQQRNLGSLGLIAAILRLAPSGLTPREIKSIYDTQTANSTLNVLEFHEALYMLKLTGFVAKNTVSRVDKLGHIVPMDIFSWRIPQSETRLSDEKIRKALFPYYLDVLREQGKRWRETRFGDFSRIIRILDRATHVQTAEVIMSLSPEDNTSSFAPQKDKVSRAKYYQHIDELQQTITKWAESLDEV